MKFEDEAEFAEEFVFQRGVKLAKLHLAEARGIVSGAFAKFAGQKVAESKTWAGGIEAHPTRSIEAGAKNLDLLRRGHTVEHEDFAGPEDITDEF